MKRIRLSVALVVGALLLLSACSVPKTVAGSPAPGTTSTPSSPWPYATATRPPTEKEVKEAALREEQEKKEGKHNESEPHDGSVSKKYSKDNPPPDTFRRADTGETTAGSGRVPLELRIKPGCVELGSATQVTVRTKSNAQVRLLSNVPQEDGSYSETTGRSGPDGLFDWRLVIPTRIGTGNYDVFAAAADDRGDDGGRTGSWILIVAAPGDCRR
jgi:hypothetical protein